MDSQALRPGWKVRCLKCGFTEDWGKYGVRLGAAGRSYTWGWCPRCFVNYTGFRFFLRQDR